MRNRRNLIDLEEMGTKDMYGNIKSGFEVKEDDLFGADGMDDFNKASND